MPRATLLMAAWLAATPALAEDPLDVREPPFGEFDFRWLNGNNPQPASLLGMGPVTWSVYVDGYYGWQFWNPVDHTVFPGTTAPRHNEISVNLAAIGAEVALPEGPIGRLYLQYGANTETDEGQDATTARGFFLTNRAYQAIQQAAAGWHFHALHGVNVEAGLFPSYIALESYLPEENWNYSHALVSDSTPYYFAGIRTQLFFTQRAKLEVWVVNGWQTFGQWHEARAGGYLLNWRPRGWLSLTHTAYAGQDAQGDPGGLRLYTDNYAQLRWCNGCARWLHSAAVAVVADTGYERRTNAPSGGSAGASVTGRFEWTQQWASTLRADTFYDSNRALAPRLPNSYALPNSDQPLWAGGVTVTMDFWPSPWLVLRLEYAHRLANTPYYSGPGGITGPGGVAPADPSTFAPDLRRFDDRVVANITLRL